MKVVYVIPGMSGDGGAERSLAAMAPRLCRDVDLHVVTFTGRTGLRGELESSGARLSDLGARNRPHLVRQLRELIRDEKPDVVHTTLIDADIVGRVAALLTGTPVVSSLVSVNHGLQHFHAHAGSSWKKVVAWTADAATARSVVRFHALTQYVADTMWRRLAIPRHRIEVIPRGRDPVKLGRRTSERRDAARAALGVGDEPLVFAAARHEAPKGLDVLLRAAALIAETRPRVRFAIGGRDGAHTSLLHRLVDELALDERVAFLGQRDDVPELMCAADVWCVPSRWEGLGSILIEAMAMEIPVVASDIGAIREVAGPDPCFNLVAPEDPEALARGILDVLDRPGAAAQRTTRARERFLHSFTVDAVATRMTRFYSTAAEASRLRRT